RRRKRRWRGERKRRRPRPRWIRRTCNSRAKPLTSSPIASKTVSWTPPASNRSLVSFSYLYSALLLFFSAMAALASSKEADWNAMRMREKELAAVKINPIDVEIIANELELDKKIAERTLREHKGDAVAAVRYLLR
ncbi:hypothetical protein BHE74_00043966, partial [Ensete ventricosum]